jgi:hypothetical protein
MKIAERILEAIQDDDLEMVAGILANDEESSDKEIIANIVDNTKLNKQQAQKLVKAERYNYLRGKYLRNKIEDDIAVLRKHI